MLFSLGSLSVELLVLCVVWATVFFARSVLIDLVSKELGAGLPLWPAQASHW